MPKIVNACLYFCLQFATIFGNQCGQKDYIVTLGGPSLFPHEIISRHHITTPVVVLECLSYCKDEAQCVGFNYRTTKDIENCQLTNVTNISNEMKGDWILMYDIEATKRKEEETKRNSDTGISIKNVPPTTSYQQAVSICTSNGKQLCNSQDICKDGKTPSGGPIQGDHWVPVKDSDNEWLQLGNSPHKPCILHSQLGQKPSWGSSTQSLVYRGYLFCCD